MQKVWRVSQAIGDIAFAYPYSLILLEIQVHKPHGHSFRNAASDDLVVSSV
jgi:hypothetical protein